MNKKYIKNINIKEFQNIIQNILIDKKINQTKIDIIKISDYCRNRINQLNQIWDEIQFFYLAPGVQIKELKKVEYKNLFRLKHCSR